MKTDLPGKDDRDSGGHNRPSQVCPTDEGEIRAKEGEKQDNQAGLDKEVREVDPILEVKAVVGEELDREVPAPDSD